MSIVVHIMIEQDNVSGSIPVEVAFERPVERVSPDPRYVGDMMQAAVIQAAADVCRYLTNILDLRMPGDTLNAIEDLKRAINHVDHTT